VGRAHAAGARRLARAGRGQRVHAHRRNRVAGAAARRAGRPRASARGRRAGPVRPGPWLYPLVLARFDLRELATGEGDHWVSGGALAICALVAADLGLAAKQLAVLRAGALDDVALALWVLALVWLPLLVGLEVVHRRVRYDLRRWATVFPVGMYAACSFAVGAAVSAPAISRFARVWVWVAVALWLVVAAATVRRLTARG
jgi:hypothetical protein